MRSIWNDRDVVIIEGAQSRLGVGNDLFDGARSIRRILCPPRNAFERYDEILAQALKLEKGVLFLIALGPTATVLSYQLFKAGYQAVDAGHVDIEYEWWRMERQTKGEDRTEVCERSRRRRSGERPCRQPLRAANTCSNRIDITLKDNRYEV